LKANLLGMVDNFEYGNFKNLTSRLRHQTGLCVGNLVPHFQHIVTEKASKSYKNITNLQVLLAGLGKGMSAPGRAREGDS